MPKKEPRYFDFLDTYGADLQVRLGYSSLVKMVNLWRKTAMEDPDNAGTGCRKVAEKALRALIKDPEAARTLKLAEMTEYAFKKGLIDAQLKRRLDSVRKVGNQGAHDSLKVIDAQNGLMLLDEILRELIVLLGIDPDFPSGEKVRRGSPFTLRTDKEMETLSQRARLAASLSGDESVESAASKARKTALQAEEQQGETLREMAEIAERLSKLKANHASDEADIGNEGIEEVLTEMDSLVPDLMQDTKAIEAKIATAERRVEEVLDEHDFIKRLLSGSSKATAKQMSIMAFPKTAGAKTSILQIAGGAGTGKTLCLLAKLIRDLDASQMSMFGDAPGKALFVCFNKNLVKYVRGLLANYSSLGDRILICNYDWYINQLVKPRTKERSLQGYGNDVRYPLGYQIYYDEGKGSSDSLLVAAMRKVAAAHPSQADDYYLDSSQAENVRWVNEEIAWLESRYDDPSVASSDYPKRVRTGRGSKRRPTERMRAVILEVWQAYRANLAASKRYTIEQATNRLMGSSSLPSFDAIAIDEAQDFSLRQIQLILKLRSSSSARVYISGDENQKIYQRDFTWKELDDGLKGLTIELDANMRNAVSIKEFAGRLLVENPVREHKDGAVKVMEASNQRIIEELREVLAKNQQDTVALIGGEWKWKPILSVAGLTASSFIEAGGTPESGLYLLGDYVCKGLEFDHVIVDYDRMVGEDGEVESRLRYVQFTRARKSLVVTYEGAPPQLLQEVYPDFL